MFRKSFNNQASKLVGSDLENIIQRFSTDDSEEIYLLHSVAISTPQSWQKIFYEKDAMFCDQLRTIRKEDLTQEALQNIALLGNLFTKAQQQLNGTEHQFGFWFWRVIFLSMCHPKLEQKVRELGVLIKTQSEGQMAEIARKAKEKMGEGFRSMNTLNGPTLDELFPDYYK